MQICNDHTRKKFSFISKTYWFIRMWCIPAWNILLTGPFIRNVLLMQILICFRFLSHTDINYTYRLWLSLQVKHAFWMWAWHVPFCLCNIAEERKMDRKNEKNEAKGLYNDPNNCLFRLWCEYTSFAFQVFFHYYWDPTKIFPVIIFLSCLGKGGNKLSLPDKPEAFLLDER